MEFGVIYDNVMSAFVFVMVFFAVMFVGYIVDPKVRDKVDKFKNK
jgi:hypothetical protein